MKIRLVKRFRRNDTEYAPGEQITVSDRDAAYLIRKGVAIEIYSTPSPAQQFRPKLKPRRKR